MVASDLSQYYSQGGVALSLQSLCISRQMPGYYTAETAQSGSVGNDVFFDEVLPDPISHCGLEFWSASASSSMASMVSNASSNSDTVTDYSFQPKTPCCGQCTVYPHRAELLFWPTPNPSPQITALTDSNHQTLYDEPHSCLRNDLT